MNDQQHLYTLAEASELTELSTEALRLRIKRGKLQSERGNDGQPRVRLTVAEREEVAQLLARRKPTLTRQDADKPNNIIVLAEVVGALREHLDRERARADAERARAERAEREREEARIRVATVEAEIAALITQAAARLREAEAARDAARTELEEWGQGGPIARALRAFLNRRGRP